jgi:hypothetical protein
MQSKHTCIIINTQYSPRHGSVPPSSSSPFPSFILRNGDGEVLDDLDDLDGLDAVGYAAEEYVAKQRRSQ